MSTPEASSFSHTWIGRRFLPERYGQPIQIIETNHGHFLIGFADGHKVTTVRGTFRTRRPGEVNQPFLF